MAGFRENLESVVASGKKIAVADVGFCQPMMAVVASVEGGENTFSVSHVNGSAVSAESLAQAAKSAKEQSAADFGAAVSEVETENGEKLVLVCLADSRSAWGAKVFAKDGESTKALAGAAITKLCEMLSETAAAGALINPDAPKPKKTPWLPVLIVMLGIAAAVILALLVAFFVGEKTDDTAALSVKNKPQANGAVVQAVEPEITTAVELTDSFDYRGGSGIGNEEELFLTVTSASEVADVSQTVQPSSVSVVQTTQVQTIKPVVSTTKPVTVTAQTATKVPVSTSKVPTKPLTTAPKVTQLSTAAHETTTKQAEASAKSGTFVFTSYGWGHGVGMSQEGAISMAKNGSDYKKIIAAYYPGTTIKADNAMPQTVKYGGVEYGLIEYLCKTSYREIGNSAPKEAIKAQLIAVYTFAKTYNFDVDSSRHAFSAGWAYENTATHKACLELFGMQSADDEPEAIYVDYNGQPAFTCYFASSAGKTASASSVWGGSYPYLCGGASSPETVDVAEFRVSSEEMKALILDYDENIVLSEDPSEWIRIVSHDGAYNSSVGYASVVRVGNKDLRGNRFRSDVCDYRLRSHCFTVKFIPD